MTNRTLADAIMADLARGFTKPEPKPIARPGTPEWDAENRETWRYMHKRTLRENANA